MDFLHPYEPWLVNWQDEWRIFNIHATQNESKNI